MSSLTLSALAVAYEDTGSTSNPKQKPIDWTRSVLRLPVTSPTTELLKVQALSSVSIVAGERVTTIDGTSQFSIALSTAGPNQYRISRTGGTVPGLRTARAVNCTGIQLAVIVGQNLSVQVVAASGSPFASVVVGDVVFIPGVSTGDAASSFNSLNEGSWTVLATSSNSMSIGRPTGGVFSALSEVVTPVAASELQVFSAAGVQVGDTMEISSGFAQTTRHAYSVVAVTASWVEFRSTAPLGMETGVIPTATGLLFYTTAKRWLRIEADQECIVRFNGDLGNTHRVEPIIPGDREFMGWTEKFGTVWKLDIENRSTAILSLVVMSAE